MPTIQLLAQLRSVTGPASFVASVSDAVPTAHDYVDPVPINIATAGNVGAAWEALPTSVTEVQRLHAVLPTGTDIAIRVDGGSSFRAGPGTFSWTFPESALPDLIEVSGTSAGAVFWLSGKA